MQDKRTTYDLGGNPTEIKFYDNDGWAYTETRTYARGYQLTDFSTSVAGDVTINTAGSYTYDTNNNLTGTKKFDASRSGSQLSYRAQWSFTFDNKNRLKTYENISAADNIRGNIWYDGKGRVWQRWNDNSSSGVWDANLKRFVYDGGTLVQEHTVAAEVIFNEWQYTYSDINRDYLRHPAGLRQREGTAASHTDYFMQADTGALEYKIERDPSAVTAERTERSASLDQIAGGSFTSGLSNLATSGDYIEMYGNSSSGFDSLVQKGGRHFLAGIEMFSSRKGNGPYTSIGGIGSPLPFSEGGETMPAQEPSDPYSHGSSSGGDSDSSECPDCCWDWFLPVRSCVDSIGKSRQCWFKMCCCNLMSLTVGVYPCGDPSINCHERCCKQSYFDSLPQATSVNGADDDCGGATKGKCWRDHWQYIKIDWADRYSQKNKYDVQMLIETLCTKVSSSGCLSLCPWNQKALCDCVKKFCDCSYTPTIHIGYWETHYWSPLNPFTIRLRHSASWTDLFHELMHFCMHHKGLYNLETRAYGCEKLCEGSEFNPNDASWSNISPCCCQDTMAFSCYSRDPVELYSEYIWRLWGILIKFDEIIWGALR